MILPPFSISVSTKIEKSFLNLIDLHFAKNHVCNSIFNRNKIKVSYSCMQNMKSVINNHNMKVLNNTAEIKESWNCRNKSNSPFDEKFLTPNIIYEAKITSNQHNYKENIYISNTDITTTWNLSTTNNMKMRLSYPNNIRQSSTTTLHKKGSGK